MIDVEAKDAFWRVVQDCLTDILGLTPADAHERSARLRERVESPPFGLSPDMVYHAEPIDIAYDLAGLEAGPAEYHNARARHQEQYETILNRHRW